MHLQRATNLTSSGRRSALFTSSSVLLCSSISCAYSLVRRKRYMSENTRELQISTLQTQFYSRRQQGKISLLCYGVAHSYSQTPQMYLSQEAKNDNLKMTQVALTFSGHISFIWHPVDNSEVKYISNMHLKQQVTPHIGRDHTRTLQ